MGGSACKIEVFHGIPPCPNNVLESGVPDYDAGFKIAAHHSGRQLSRLGGVIPDVWGPLRGEVHATERLADRAFHARVGRENFIVYMEAYTRWNASAPWSVLGKSGLLSERER